MAEIAAALGGMSRRAFLAAAATVTAAAWLAGPGPLGSRPNVLDRLAAAGGPRISVV